jgi:hypothetical protein
VSSARLREVDDRYLPLAAAWLRARADSLAARRARLVALAAAWEPQALDARYGGRMPFAALRTNPVLGLVVASAVLAGGLATAVVEEGRDHGSDRSPSVTELLPQGDAPRGTVLGPQVGTSTRDYVRSSTDGLVDAVRTTPDGQRVALVSLSDYRTPEQTDALLKGFVVRRVFMRAKAAGKEATALPVDVRGDLLTELRKAYEQTSRTRAQAQRSYQGYVDTLRPDSTQDRAFRDLYAAFARSSGIEAREYGHDCACVYAVLVTSTPTLLLSLNARPGVRAVQVAGAGINVLQVQVQPLLPEVTGVVPKPRVGGLS